MEIHLSDVFFIVSSDEMSPPGLLGTTSTGITGDRGTTC